MKTKINSFETFENDQILKKKFGENENFFVFILNTTGKRVKIVLNFENEKKVLQNFKNFFFPRRFGISKRLD